MNRQSGPTRCSPVAGEQKSAAKPFLKWVGGKRQLLPELLPLVPKSVHEGTSRYFEPFIGGGALFFACLPPRATLADVNPALVECYEAVRDNLEELIHTLKEHIYDREYYLELRAADRKEGFSEWSPTRRAARLIYLNRCGYNGLYRTNKNGQFNVPFGRYSNPTICDTAVLTACSAALQGVELRGNSFEWVLEHAESGDFVYFDPPYVPLSATSSFTGYAAGGFDLSCQQTLAELCQELSDKGVQFMLSNSSAPLVFELYEGFRVDEVLASRAVNSKVGGRGKIKEVLVRNF